MKKVGPKRKRARQKISIGQRNRQLYFFNKGLPCALCGVAFKTEKEITMDHIVPKSKGGPDHMSNYQPAHLACNIARGNKDMEPKAEPKEALQSENSSQD